MFVVIRKRKRDWKYEKSNTRSKQKTKKNGLNFFKVIFQLFFFLNHVFLGHQKEKRDGRKKRQCSTFFCFVFFAFLLRTMSGWEIQQTQKKKAQL